MRSKLMTGILPIACSSFLFVSSAEPNFSYLPTLFRVSSSKLCTPTLKRLMSPSKRLRLSGEMWFGSLSAETSSMLKRSFASFSVFSSSGSFISVVPPPT